MKKIAVLILFVSNIGFASETPLTKLKAGAIDSLNVVSTTLQGLIEVVNSQKDLDAGTLAAICNTLTEQMAPRTLVTLNQFQAAGYEMIAKSEESKVLSRQIAYGGAAITNDLLVLAGFCNEQNRLIAVEFDLQVMTLPFKSVSDFKVLAEEIAVGLDKMKEVIKSIPEVMHNPDVESTGMST
jgi:hypothetical protein